MKEQLITFETAKLAKEKGFEVDSGKYWIETFEHMLDIPRNGKVTFPEHKPRILSFIPTEEYHKYHCNSCTQSLLQKWLREVHNTDVFVNPFKDHAADINENAVYKYCIWNNSIGSEFSETYEEALEKGLQEGLKLIKYYEN